MKALFLDRDGVINVDTGHPSIRSGIKFNELIFPLARRFYERGYQIFIITNQAGIAKGIFDLATLNETIEFFEDRFRVEGAPITHTYFCPHHPNASVAEYRRECLCRKPKPGMIIKAQKDFSIELGESIFLGDKLSDIEAARMAGIGMSILITNNNIRLIHDTLFPLT